MYSSILLASAVSNKYIKKLGAIGRGYPWLPENASIVDAYTPFEAEGCDLPRSGVPPGRYVCGDKEIFAMYVRRELRDLDDEDRQRFLKTMMTVYDTKTGAGQEVYGEAFLGMDTLVLLHHEGASQRDADHLHQGVGFLANHAKLTLLFERSLQAVDHRVALPYWDSTIDMAQVQEGLISSVFETELWSDRWFGTVSGFYNNTEDFDPLDDQWTIQDGPFAKLRKNDVIGDHPPRNAYGLLRAPWNNNPSPYVTRFPKKNGRLPNCGTHRQFAESETDLKGKRWSRAQWMYDVSNEPHGGMHSTPGGMVTIGAVNDRSTAILESFGVHDVKQHTLWRFHVLDFPTECDAIEKCRPWCALETWNLTSIGYEIVKAQVNMPEPEILADWRSRPDDLAFIADAYCFPGPDMLISGDAKDSGGSIEPSFWPIHPAITRLYQYRLLVGPGFSDDDWPLDGACFGARSADVDPDRLAFRIDDVLTPCGFAECCGGHFSDSRLYLQYPNHTLGPTNNDILRLLDPRTGPHFDYPVYHHFRWPHCADIGIPFHSDNDDDDDDKKSDAVEQQKSLHAVTDAH